MSEKKLWNKNFILLLQGNNISLLGDVIYSMAISYYVYQKTNSTALMSLVASISMAVRFVVYPLAGAICDQLNKKRIMVYMDFIRGILMLVLYGWIQFNGLSIPLIMAISFVAACCDTLFSPAVENILLDILDNSHLVKGQSINRGIQSTIDLIGNSIGGALIAMFGVLPIILFNGISYIISAITELFISVEYKAGNSKLDVKNTIQTILNGGKMVLQDPIISKFFFLTIVANFLCSGLSTMMLPICLNKNMSVELYGIFMAICSFTGIVASFFMGIIDIKKEKKYDFTFICYPISTLCLALCMAFKNSIVFMAIYTLSVFFNILANAMFNATFMISIPKDNRGTIIGFIASSSMIGAFCSTLTYGFLGELIPIEFVAIIADTLLTIILIVFYIKNNKLISPMFEN